MMIRSKNFWLIVSMLLLLIQTACNLPASATQIAATPDLAATAASETLNAILTEISSPSATRSGETAAAPSQGTQIPGTPASATIEATSPAESPTPEPSPTATQDPYPTAGPAPTSTLDPYPTAGPAPTSTPSDPKLALGSPDWQDTFDNGDNWPLYEDEHVGMQIDDGRLEMTAFNADSWDSWMIARPELGDFYIEVTATPGDCSGLDRYGLLVRAPEANQGYLFGVSCDGQYSLRIWDGDQFHWLLEWAPGASILTGSGQTNRLGLMAQGQTLSLYANGSLLAEVTDDTYSAGSFGPFIGAANTPNFQVAFDEISYWDLP